MAVPGWRKLAKRRRPPVVRSRRRRRPRPIGRLEPLETRALLSGGSIALGPQTGFNDQPYIEVELISQPDPELPSTGIGPYGSGFDIYPYRRLLLDTGANSLLIVSDAVTDLEAAGYQTEGAYREQGVAGYSEFDVSAPYRIDFRGTDDVPHTLPQTVDQNRILSSPDLHLAGRAAEGGIPGIVGMPVMVNRVTTLDVSSWAGVTDLFEMEPMQVTFSDTVPPGDGHRYTVALDDRVSFDPADGLPPESPADAPLPVWAPIPFLTAVVEFRGRRQAGSFLLDTGAQFSVISSNLAFDVGMDLDGDGNFDNEKIMSIPVGGIGGTIDAPILVIDKFRLPTEQGPDLVWQIGDPDDPEDIGVAVIVLDIAPGIDGVFGVDLLTSGLDLQFDVVTLDIVMEGSPYFQKIHFDFRDMMNGSGRLILDLDPALDLVVADATVVARRVFYNNSKWDAHAGFGDGDPAANAFDDGAIATDKTALLPGQTATFANYTSYSRGINGIMVDVGGLANPAEIDAADFIFGVRNDNGPDVWSEATAPTSVSVRQGEGVGGSDRVTIIWADNTIEQEWLQVTVVANDDTGLLQNDVFYFGNSIGETTGDFQVEYGDAFDVIWPALFTGNAIGVDHAGDVNRDGRIDYSDVFDAVWPNLFGPSLVQLAPPAAPAPLLESTGSVFNENRPWAIELMWFDELYGASSDSEEEEEDALEATAVDGAFSMYDEE